MAINNITGSPVEGENFFGRENELKSAWTHIKKGNSLILSAPRRVGKSSFAKKLISYAEEENWNTLEINLEEIQSEQKFVELFVEKLQAENWWKKNLSSVGDSLSQLLENIKTSVSYGDTTATIEWKSRKPDIYTKLKKLLNHEQHTLIMVDEVTILLNGFLNTDKEIGIESVEFFLNWLRGFRQVKGTKIHWVFCSSIGIDNFTNRHNLSYTFNDIKSFPLAAFDPETSVDFIKELAKSDNLPLDDEIINLMVHKIEWCLPYFIQVLYFNFQNLVTTYNKPNDSVTLDTAYQELIDSKELNTWDERLTDYQELDEYARIILTNLSKIKPGAKRDALLELLHTKINDTVKAESYLNKLLYMLKNDGYITDMPKGKYGFRSPLLRDFWFNRFAK